jgi:hypothetical protein
MIDDQTDMLPDEIHARGCVLTDDERLANLNRFLQDDREEEREEWRFFWGVLSAILLVIPLWWAIVYAFSSLVPS